jgi:hypothetical protein
VPDVPEAKPEALTPIELEKVRSHGAWSNGEKLRLLATIDSLEAELKRWEDYEDRPCNHPSHGTIDALKAENAALRKRIGDRNVY